MSIPETTISLDDLAILAGLAATVSDVTPQEQEVINWAYAVVRVREVPPRRQDGAMSESYELVVIDIPGSEEQVYVRTWESGQVDVDYRSDHSATWMPVDMLGGSFRLEPSE